MNFERMLYYAKLYRLRNKKRLFRGQIYEGLLMFLTSVFLLLFLFFGNFFFLIKLGFVKLVTTYDLAEFISADNLTQLIFVLFLSFGLLVVSLVFYLIFYYKIYLQSELAYDKNRLSNYFYLHGDKKQLIQEFLLSRTVQIRQLILLSQLFALFISGFAFYGIGEVLQIKFLSFFYVYIFYFALVLFLLWLVKKLTRDRYIQQAEKIFEALE